MRTFLIAIAGLLAFRGSHAQFVTNTGIDLTNSTELFTNGDWENQGGTLVNHGTINTSAAFVNNGTLRSDSRGGFALAFASDLAFKPGGAVMGFISKSGAGAALLDGSVNLRDSLLIRDGLIRVASPDDTVSLLAAATLLASETSYVEGGHIARGGTGDLVFPFGKDGFYLPLKIYKAHAQRITASLANTTPGYTAGPGVDALIGFPYVWKVTKKAAADTAAYIEVNYPNSLPVVSNPIVVREVANRSYASMGARLIRDSGTRTTVKSYSRRLKGLFSVAQGFPSDPVTDSLALVSLYNSTGGPQWTNNTNWLSGLVETWFGVTVNGQSITAVELPANNLTGDVADPLVDILSLQTINLSANSITAIPDFTLNPEVTSLNVSDNSLDFSSLEPNASIVGINYFVQDDIGTASETEIPVGTSYQLTLPGQGSNSQYQWKFEGEDIVGANGATYTLAAIGRNSMGAYTAQVTHPAFPGLILNTAPQTLLAYAEVSGKLLIEANAPASAGTMTLFKVQPGAFEAASTVPVANDGTYLFDRVILDDYQVRGFADTLLHARALPTYYESTIFWEEADTLELVDNIPDLDIISQLEPAPPSGKGSISGYLQEDDGMGRVLDPERNKRIARAGVSARRVERTGRLKEEILTLVAYVFTNEDGEFTLPNLPTGEYRINFQYPGYPMDETSYTTITIGTAFESQVMVEANVVDGKINVRKLVITGLPEDEHYNADVFPNPAAEDIRIRFAAEVAGRTVMLSDLQGVPVYRSHAGAKEVSFTVRHLPAGLYILRIQEGEKKVKTMKISIEY